MLEGDITGCYDNIRQQWMLENIVTDQEVLRKWLEAGYVEDGRLYPTRKGTPQGGIISPTLANLTLDGLERAVHDAVPRRSRVNFVRYADDFIITGKSRRLLEEQVKPAVEAFLRVRGLELSSEKTVITHLTQGFTFLGQTFRRRGKVLRITPAKEGVLALIRKVGTLIRTHVAAPMPTLVKKLNLVLRGWGHYHRHVVASETFARIDRYVREQLWRMLQHRHPQKSKRELFRKYWTVEDGRHIFTVRYKTEKGSRTCQVLRLGALPSGRYIKIPKDANPYLPDYGGRYAERRQKKERWMMSCLSAHQYRAQRAGG